MPAVKGKSGLMAKYGNKLDTAAKTHATDETDYGPTRLPGGINNGIAQLIKCYFDQYKTGNYQGEYYFRAEGVVLEPVIVQTKHGEMKVAGLHTSIMIPVCDTRSADGKLTTLDEHVAQILNEMMKLGGEEFTAGASGGDMEAMAEQLKEAAPFFKFSTSQSAPTEKYPDPRVWENWNGTKGLEEYVPEVNGQVEDNTVAQKPDAPPPTPSKKPTVAPPKAQPSAKAPPKPPVEPPPPAEEFNEFEDLGSLGTLASSDDEGEAIKAREKLTEMALAGGATADQVAEAADWQAVADLIGSTPTEGGESQEEKPWEPMKGDVYLYKPLDPKTKKPVKKGVEVEVMSVDLKGKTVSVQTLDAPKRIFKGLKWDALETQ